MHKRKFGITDEIFVTNVGGHISFGTRSEKECA